MKNYLPKYERTSNVIENIFNAIRTELENLGTDIELIDRNLLIDSAVEKLTIYERDIGIKNHAQLSNKQRREQIISRNIASFDQTTEETIKSVCRAYSNGEVEIRNTDIDGMYEIFFVGTLGIPDNIEGLRQSLDVIFPAHLGFRFEYKFNTWDAIKTLKWGSDVENMTWAELKEYKKG